MRYWAATVSEDRFAGERLYAFDNLTLPEPGRPGSGPDGKDSGPGQGDLVALVVAGAPPRLFGLGQVRQSAGLAGSGVEPDELVVTYTHRLFDEPAPIGDLLPELAGLAELDPDRYASLVVRAGPARADTSEWFVSLALPIEATSRAEAVREFWTHVAKLGPRELPAYVWPQADELAMQAFLLGEETNLDPEEE